MMEKSYLIPEKQWRYGYTQDMEGHARLYQEGLVTRKSVIQGEVIGRPLALRLSRASYWNEIMAERDKLVDKSDENNLLNIKNKIRTILDIASERDRVYAHFLHPRPIVIDIPSLGAQQSEYVDLVTRDTKLDEPPIVVIPGISNDVTGCAGFPVELALSTNRRVIVIAHPDSWSGNLTKEFVKSMKKSKNFEPHVRFFESAINQIIGSNTKFDICGISAGAIIASEIIKDDNFVGKILNKNLITPPGLTPVYEGILKRLKIQRSTIIEERRKNSLPRLCVTDIKLIKKDSEKRQLQRKAFLTMALKLTKVYPWWEGLEGANIVVANQDVVTYGIKHIDKIVKFNSKLHVQIIDGGHEVVGTEPEKVINEMVL